jgi:hypothetical protein
MAVADKIRFRTIAPEAEEAWKAKHGGNTKGSKPKSDGLAKGKQKKARA